MYVWLAPPWPALLSLPPLLPLPPSLLGYSVAGQGSGSAEAGSRQDANRLRCWLRSFAAGLQLHIGSFMTASGKSSCMQLI